MSTQQPDTKPGFYYVTALYRERYVKLLGPFKDDHQAALDRVDEARRWSIHWDPCACWYAYGTCRTESDEGPGVIDVHRQNWAKSRVIP